MSAATEPVEAPLPEGPVDKAVPDSGPAPVPDPHTTAGKLADLYRRIDLTVRAGIARPTSACRTSAPTVTG